MWICHVTNLYIHLPCVVHKGQKQRVNILQGASCTEKFYRGKNKARPYNGGISYFTQKKVNNNKLKLHK
jgi:hypothetical protein